MKRSEVLFIGTLLCAVPLGLYFMSNTTRYESHEIECISKNKFFKVNYETLSVEKMAILEKNKTQRSVVLTEVSDNTFSFSEEEKTYKINLDTLNALVIDDGLTTIFECKHDIFKM